jgi:hypothetical protein
MCEVLSRAGRKVMIRAQRSQAQKLCWSEIQIGLRHLSVAFNLLSIDLCTLVANDKLALLFWKPVQIRTPYISNHEQCHARRRTAADANAAGGLPSVDGQHES